MARVLRVDESEDDAKFVAQFRTDLDSLIGMTLEMFVDNRVLLLSPVMRDLIVEKARVVKSRWQPMKDKLHVDNPCQSLLPVVDAR